MPPQATSSRNIGSETTSRNRRSAPRGFDAGSSFGPSSRSRRLASSSPSPEVWADTASMSMRTSDYDGPRSDMAAGHESGLHGGDAPPALSFLPSPRRISSAFHDNGINSDF